LLTTRDSELYRRAMICPIPRGFLVAVEGIDGSGKTTQAERLARYCDEKRLTYILSKEPTRGKYGQLIRNSASHGRLSVEEEIDLLLKDRREHVAQVIQPALDQEKVVILDRHYKIGLNGEDLVDMIGSSIMYAFQRAAAEKIAKYDVSPSGANRMRRLFGGTPILA